MGDVHSRKTPHHFQGRRQENTDAESRRIRVSHVMRQGIGCGMLLLLLFN